MKTGWKSMMVVGAVQVILSSLVTAQPIKGGPGQDADVAKPVVKSGPKEPGAPGGWILTVASWLDLTREQVELMEAIVEEARPKAKEAAEVVAAAQEALHEAITGGASEEEIRVAATALGTVIGDQAVLHAQTLASIKAMLTEGQLERFDKIKAKLTQLAQLTHSPKFRDADAKSSKSQPQDETGKTPTGKGDAGVKLPADGETTALEKVFKAADANKDGVLTVKELHTLLVNTKDAKQAPKK